MNRIANFIAGARTGTLLLIGCLLFINGCKQQSIVPVHSERDFQTFAEVLLSTVPANQKIAIRPFSAQDSPIPLADANRFNTSLEQAIRERFPDRFRFVPREALQKIAADAEEFGQIEDFSRYVRQQQADILIFGQLELMGDRVLLTYRSANPNTGHLLAETPSRSTDYRLPKAPALALEPALALLADKLAAERLSIQRLYKGGIFFEESGIQTPLGHYLMQRLETLVTQRLERFPKYSAGDYLEEEKGRALPQHSFVLSGQYWSFYDHIELRVSLKGRDIQRTHQVRVDSDTIPKKLRAQARPPLPKPSENDHLGPNPLYLSSNRGRRPVYKIGEEMYLTLQARESGYIYCFNAYYQNGSAIITRIFPNRYHKDPYVSPWQTLQLPDESMDFVFTLQPPAGPEYAHCYLFDRDVTRQLPAEIAEKDLVPLSLNSIDDLNAIMRGIPNTRLNQATLALTVEKR